MSKRYHHGDLPRALREAALQQVSEGSIASVTIAAAARSVGVSSGAPYQHYRDREDLLADVARDTMDQMTSRFLDVAASGMPARARLAALVEEFVSYSIEHPSRFRVLHEFSARVLADERGLASANANAEPFLEAARAAFGSLAAPVATAAMFAVAVGYSEVGVTDGIAERMGVSRSDLPRHAAAVTVAALAAFDSSP
jgi:AcrR family transcriptional regulator